MRTGAVDPGGMPVAEQARRLAGLAAFLGALGLGLWGCCFAYLLWR
jgi:hypothetical protein